VEEDGGGSVGVAIDPPIKSIRAWGSKAG